MKENKLLVLISASNLLDYPTSEWKNELYDLQADFLETVESEALKQEFNQAINPILSMSDKELRECYVNSFDLSNQTGLYLTAHELGDSSKRGAALIRLKNIVEGAGYSLDEKELGDFMPMLFELVAVAEENEELQRLERRLSVAVQRIIDHLDEDHPYLGIFHLLMNYAFSKPSTDEIIALENNREKADLEELPYPIMYQ